MDVTVVGAGVIGLSTALVLEEHGHTVKIVAAATREHITSWVAGAVWFPYRCGPAHRVTSWSARTRTWLADLARTEPDAGVDVLTGYEITPDDSPPWWRDACEIEWVPAPVTGQPGCWRFVAPRCEPALFLPWLERQIDAEIECRNVTDLDAEAGDVVVNCTGLGARALCNDAALVGVQGQILVTTPHKVDLAASITDDRNGEEIFYVIPRRDEVVVGGIARPWPTDQRPPIDDAITERVLRQAVQLGVKLGDILRIHTGLRPFRPEVRLERAGRIIHNYGHGGAGFTMCRGCAEDVVALL